MKSSAAVAILFVPILFVILSVNVRNTQGPHFQSFFSDPTYAYLLNSLNITKGESPGHTDHPGTTVQLLGGLVIKAHALLGQLRGDKKTIEIKVLEDPEYYINNIGNVLYGIIALSVLLFGIRTYQFSNRIDVVIIVQAFPLTFPALIEHLPRLEPEPLLIALSFLLATALLPLLYSTKISNKKLLSSAVLAGVIMGFGVITKVTFVPLLIFGLLYPGLKNKFLVAASFLITIAILTIPIWQVVPQTIEWVTNLLTHSGHYGTGTIGLPSIDKLSSNFFSLWGRSPEIFIFLPLLLTAILFLTNSSRESNLRYVCVVSFLSLFLHLAIVIKHTSIHYLVPSMAFSGFILFILITAFDTRMPFKFVSSLLVFSLSCFSFFNINKATQVAKNQLLHYRNQHDEFTMLKEMATQENCRTASYYRSSSLEFALAFGNGYAQGQYTQELNRLYPDFLSYNIWGNFFTGFTGHYSKLQINQLLQNSNPICLVGTIPLPYDGQPHVSLIEQGEQTNLYQFLGWNENNVEN